MKQASDGAALVLLLAIGLSSLLLVAIFALGVISLMELSMVNIAWRLLAAVGIGSFFALVVAARFLQTRTEVNDDSADSAE